jgi:hypothetical protein
MAGAATNNGYVKFLVPHKCAICFEEKSCKNMGEDKLYMILKMPPDFAS